MILHQAGPLVKTAFSLRSLVPAAKKGQRNVGLRMTRKSEQSAAALQRYREAAAKTYNTPKGLSMEALRHMAG